MASLNGNTVGRWIDIKNLDRLGAGELIWKGEAMRAAVQSSAGAVGSNGFASVATDESPTRRRWHLVTGSVICLILYAGLLMVGRVLLG